MTSQELNHIKNDAIIDDPKKKTKRQNTVSVSSPVAFFSTKVVVTTIQEPTSQSDLIKIYD